MILVDTTVWIDYFNGRVTPYTNYLDQILLDQLVLIGDLILAETLQGFTKDVDFEKARKGLEKLSQVQMLNYELAVRSAMNYRSLRKMGVTVRKTIDCLIATFCIEGNHELLHNDHDFDPFEVHLGLKVVHP